MERKFVYTLSSRRQMINDAVRSIKTLQQYVNSENIIVFYTPPRKERHEQLFDRLDVDVRLRPNKAEEFRAVPHERARHYGDKLYVCDVDANQVAFLDCDTIVTEHPRELFEGEFEFAARPDNAELGSEWMQFTEEIGETSLPWMPNAGLLVFKQGSHRRIQQEWQKYINKDFHLDIGEKSYRDQYSLTIAASKLDSRKLNKRHHVFEWADEPYENGIVYHTERNDSDLPSEIAYPLSKLYAYYQELVRRK